MTDAGVGHEVVPAARHRWREVSDALAAAFTDDPVFRWLLPHDDSRPRALRRFFAIEARRIVLKLDQSVLAADRRQVAGAALVLPPGQWRTPLSVTGLFGPRYTQIFGARLPRALRVLNGLERQHLRPPHVYFPYIGVVPDAQGQGLGTALMTPVLQRCDRDGIPAYLEASNPSCARLYERLGFVGFEEITPAGSPPIRLMLREPAA
jgi:GNAT superfamily N-acetyltransferase